MAERKDRGTEALKKGEKHDVSMGRRWGEGWMWVLAGLCGRAKVICPKYEASEGVLRPLQSPHLPVKLSGVS